MLFALCGVKLIKLILCKWNKYKFLAINFCHKFYVFWVRVCVCVFLGYCVHFQSANNSYCKSYCNNHWNSVSFMGLLTVSVYVCVLIRWFFPNIIICKLVTCILQNSSFFSFVVQSNCTWFLHLSFCIVNRVTKHFSQ